MLKSNLNPMAVMNQENSFNAVSTTTKKTTRLDIDVTLSSGEETISMSFDHFNHEYLNSIRRELSPILNAVITNLINSRDLIGLQLNFEFENISSEEYEKMEDNLLIELSSIDPYSLKEDIYKLMKLTDRSYNSEEISTMFNCTHDAAEKAIELLLIDEA